LDQHLPWWLLERALGPDCPYRVLVTAFVAAINKRKITFLQKDSEQLRAENERLLHVLVKLAEALKISKGDSAS
jgi:hypothetical protein